MFSRRMLLSGLLGATLLAASFPIGAARAEPLEEFKVGYQKGSAILVIAKQREVFEKRLKKLGVDNVKWVEFQFGPPLLEALGTGAVDIGVVGDTPPIFAQSAGANLGLCGERASVSFGDPGSEGFGDQGCRRSQG